MKCKKLWVNVIWRSSYAYNNYYYTSNGHDKFTCNAYGLFELNNESYLNLKSQPIWKEREPHKCLTL